MGAKVFFGQFIFDVASVAFASVHRLLRRRRRRRLTCDNLT